MENLETFLQEKAADIRKCLDGINEDEIIGRKNFVDIGIVLTLVKEKIGERLIPWMAAEFGVTEEIANRMWRLTRFERWSQNNRDQGLKVFLQDKEQSIRTHLERARESHEESIVNEQFADMGLELILVKERIGSENLISWLMAEFRSTEAQAEDFWRLAYFARWSQDNLELGLDEFGDPIKRELD